MWRCDGCNRRVVTLRRSGQVSIMGMKVVAGTEIREPGMLDPQAVLGQASQGRAPASWRVFTKERGRVRGFLRGTSGDPDPLLVITPFGVVEYVDSKKPVAVVDFDSLSQIRLRVTGGTSTVSTQVHLDVWSYLTYHT